jgi:hypothetical protein
MVAYFPGRPRDSLEKSFVHFRPRWPGQSALNFAAARLRQIAGTGWSTKRYLNIELLKDQEMRDAITV